MLGFYPLSYTPWAADSGSTVTVAVVLLADNVVREFIAGGTGSAQSDSLVREVVVSRTGAICADNLIREVLLVPVTAAYANVLVRETLLGSGGVTTPGDRSFLIAGVKQVPIAPGIVMLPTSEVVPISGNGYAIGSSQFYTIVQVSWNSEIKTEGVDYTLVAPFSHIIQFDRTGISTEITLVYYQWDIGVSVGFKVNSYPVTFSFTGTSIIAETIPPLNTFFTVQYTSTRIGTNPMSLFARFTNLVDDIWLNHTLYDEPLGFSTNRPIDYKVFDISDNSVWGWDGTVWYFIGPFADEDIFFVTQTSQLYKYSGGSVSLVYTAGDGPNATYPEILTYPPFGESIGMNLLADAFSADAAIVYPSAAVIAARPGTF